MPRMPLRVESSLGLGWGLKALEVTTQQVHWILWVMEAARIHR